MYSECLAEWLWCRIGWVNVQIPLNDQGYHVTRPFTQQFKFLNIHPCERYSQRDKSTKEGKRFNSFPGLLFGTGAANIAPCVRQQWSFVKVWEKQQQKALSPSSVLTRPVLTLATPQSLPGDRWQRHKDNTGGWLQTTWSRKARSH